MTQRVGVPLRSVEQRGEDVDIQVAWITVEPRFVVDSDPTVFYRQLGGDALMQQTEAELQQTFMWRLLPPDWQKAVLAKRRTGRRRASDLELALLAEEYENAWEDVPKSPMEELGPPKTSASVRTVPMPAVVGDALAAHLAEFPPGQDGLIFATPSGGPVRRTTFWDTWRQAVKDAGLREGLRFHELRHFYASLLIRYGESVKVVQDRLGHASAAETLDTYSHLWPDSEDRTRAAVDAVLGSSCVTGVSRPEAL